LLLRPGGRKNARSRNHWRLVIRSLGSSGSGRCSRPRSRARSSPLRFHSVLGSWQPSVLGRAAAVNLPLALAVWVGILFVRYLPGRECRPDVRSAGHRRRLARHAPCPPVRRGRSAGAARAPAGLARGDGAVGVAVAPLEQESGKRRSGALALVCGHAHLPGAHHDHLYTGAGSHDSLGLPPRSTGVGRRRHASGGLESSSDAIERATATEGRLQGGGGDPNFLAAGLIPAVGLAGALMAGDRRVLVRGGLLAAIAILTVGFAATQSRGGLVAAAMTLVASR